MDRSLDEIIAERPQRPSNRNRGQAPGGRPRRSNFPREGINKSYRADRADVDRDWVHDKFEDDRDTRPSNRGQRARYNRNSPPAEQSATGTKLRVNNLHYDITENDLEDLFTRIGPVSSVSLLYDRAGRSEGIAFVTYKRQVDAHTAIREFDGANAKGQPIRLSTVQSTTTRTRNPFDYVEKPKGSLFERAERPRDRDARSLSPDSEGNDNNGGRGRTRRSDVSKPPPEHIDRYIPGQRSSRNRNDGGRNRGRRDNRDRNDGRRDRNTSGRPRKTQEQLDQELEDYWGSGNAQNDTTVETGAATTAPPPAPAAAGDDDIDMIE